MQSQFLPILALAATQEVISFNLWQMLISLCNLLILFLILKKFLYKPVRKMLAARQKELDDTVKETEDAKAGAEADAAKWAEKLSKADEESDRRIRTATDLAKSESEKILANAKADADQMVRSAKDQIELEQRAADQQMKKEIADLSAALAEKMLEREINPKDHDRLIESFLTQLDEPETK
ncbi:MAG: F0F1 ATP synthase subunit B [Eubacteriales bacterium]